MINCGLRFKRRPQRMIWVDYVFIGIIALSMLIGAWRGLVREALSLIAWIAAFVLAFRHAPELMPRLESWIASPIARSLTAYALVFVAVLIAGALISWIVSKIVNGAGLSGVDRMLGASFGIARGLFIIATIMLLVGSQRIQAEPVLQQSTLMPTLQPLVTGLHSLVPENWLSFLDVPASSRDSKAAQKTE